MRKNLFTNLLLVTMLTTLLLTGCGSSSGSSEVANETTMTITTEVTNTTSTQNNTTETAMDTLASVTTEETVETETVIETVPSEETEATEETVESLPEYEESASDTRLEDSMLRVYRVVEAYEHLMKEGYELNLSIQNDIEQLTTDTFNLTGYTFADGKGFTHGYSFLSTGIHYYNEYVNNNGSHYNMADWIKEQPDSETVAKMYMPVGSDFETNDCLLMEAIAVANFLKNCKYVVGTELIETNEYVISGITSSYAIKLDCDGNTDLLAVFDAEGNLLNIRTPDNFPYLFTW